MIHMVTLAQPCVGAGETLAPSHKYCITDVLIVYVHNNPYISRQVGV